MYVKNEAQTCSQQEPAGLPTAQAYTRAGASDRVQGSPPSESAQKRLRDKPSPRYSPDCCQHRRAK